jgi:hypothetical protein
MVNPVGQQPARRLVVVNDQDGARQRRFSGGEKTLWLHGGGKRQAEDQPPMAEMKL